MGLLAIASLTACGDKVELTTPVTPAPSAVVHQVTVSPSSVTLNIGDKTTLAASVNADAGVTDRTVTWSSADATIASVDANGVVTAVKAGNTSIIAKAKADATVQAAAAVTVTAGPIGGPATVTVSTINQTVCVVGGGCSSVPANLGNVTGQIDVTLNVDPGTQRLVGVDLIMNCSGNGNSGADTVVATQTLASSNVAVDAAASNAPVTLSFNTASFNSTSGAVAFRNGACTIKGRARTNATAGGAITTVTSTSSNVTLNNTDVVVGSTTAAKSAINPVTGLSWSGGATVTVVATPVMFSGRVPGTLSVTFAGVTAATPSNATGTSTFVFNNGGGASGVTNNITGITNAAATATFALIDSQGQSFTTNPCGGLLCSPTSVLAGAAVSIGPMRLDTQKPAPGNLALNPNTQQGTITSWVGGGFKFTADSASGYAGPDSTAVATACLGGLARVCNLDNGGVDSVKVAFFFNTTASRTAGAGSPITSAGSLAETVANTTNTLAMITTDALGNADTSFASTNGGVRSAAFSAFGVDKTAPVNTQTGTANQTTTQALGTAGNVTATITDGLSGPAAQQLVAQVVLNNVVTGTTTSQPANQSNYSNFGTVTAATGPNAGGCIIGRFNRLSGAANADTLALPVFNAAGVQTGTCSPTPYSLGGGTTVASNVSSLPGYVTTRVVAIDQAGNRAAATSVVIAEDATAPTVGALDLPTSATGGSSLTIPAQVFDANDVVSSAIQITYNGIANTFQTALTAGPGTAFDNVLTPGSATTAATASPVISVFARNIKAGAAGTLTVPTQAANGANTVAVGVLDQSNNAGITATPVTLTSTTAITQPSTTPWATDFVNGMTVTVNNATVSNCPTAGCAGGPPAPAPTNPTTTTVTVTASGTSGTFANPFSTVQVWYQVNGAGPWFFAGNAGTGSSRDTGVGGARFWDYTFVFTPPKTSPRNVATGATTSLTTGGPTLSIVGIGLNATGDALITPTPVVVTLSNP